MGEWRSGRLDSRVEHVERVDFNAEAQGRRVRREIWTMKYTRYTNW